MRIWIPFAALALAAPALAQQGSIETQPLEPLFIPGPTQGNDGQGAGITVRPVEPLGQEGAGQTRRAPQEGEGGLLSEGFNDKAFIDGEGSFVDRAFPTEEPEQQDEYLFEPEEETDLGQNDGANDGDGGAESDGGGFSTNWFGSDDEPTAEGGQEQTIDQDQPRFMEAPFATRGLFGPNVARALPQIATVPAEGAEIRQLDKMTGTTNTVTMAAGEERELGRLRVRLETCRQPEEGGTHGTVAYLRVWDPNRDEKEPVFSGWMFAESPALSALDHPRYDVWVLGCTPTKAAKVGEPAESQKEASKEEG